MLDQKIIDEMKARLQSPGLNMNDADLMQRAVTFMEGLWEDNCRLADMVSKSAGAE